VLLGALFVPGWGGAIGTELWPVRYRSQSNGHRLLGRREEEVARLVAEGMANREIAEKLHLSEHTVSNYLFRIYEKLGISSRVELVLYVLRQRQPAI
jgi:DNA-binding NarL/FixJ family response regulator